MRLPRKGILIRIAIYGTIITVLGVRALLQCNEERAAKQSEVEELGTPRTMTLPDGKQVQVIEITPEKAAQLGYTAPPTVGPAPEAKRPEATPADAKVPDAADPDAKQPAAGSAGTAAPPSEAAN